MSYLDYSRFAYEIHKPPTNKTTIVLDDFAYAYSNTGYRISHLSNRYKDLNFEKIWKIDIHVSEYTFAINGFKENLLQILNNAEEKYFISVYNYLDEFEDVYKRMLEWIPNNNKKIFLEFYHSNIKNLDVKTIDLDYIRSCQIPANVSLIDVHYTMLNKTLAIQLFPVGLQGEY